MDQKAYWVGFNMVRGIGAVRFQSLLNYFGTLENAWKATLTQLQEAGLNRKAIDYLIALRGSIDLEQIWTDLEKKDITLLTWHDENYPAHLKQINQSPPVLYYKGTILPEDEWSVAIVGTRRMTAYGRQVTLDMSENLSRNRVTIVSGLARGVDSVAHQTALNCEGRTIAVLGSGVDQIYPPENRKLAEKIIERGCLISEYAPGTPPESINFPPRNRIISGLTLATVIIEAGDTSGALITASFAAEQGREVFAVPGNIHSPASKGTNRLIQDGAHPLLNPQEILEALNLENVPKYQQARLLLPEDEVENKLLTLLTHEPLHIDEILLKSGLPIEKISSALVIMELKGLLRQEGVMTYSAIKDDSNEYHL